MSVAAISKVVPLWRRVPGRFRESVASALAFAVCLGAVAPRILDAQRVWTLTLSGSPTLVAPADAAFIGWSNGFVGYSTDKRWLGATGAPYSVWTAISPPDSADTGRVGVYRLYRDSVLIMSSTHPVAVVVGAGAQRRTVVPHSVMISRSVGRSQAVSGDGRGGIVFTPSSLPVRGGPSVSTKQLLRVTLSSRVLDTIVALHSLPPVSRLPGRDSSGLPVTLISLGDADDMWSVLASGTVIVLHPGYCDGEAWEPGARPRRFHVQECAFVPRSAESKVSVLKEHQEFGTRLSSARAVVRVAADTFMLNNVSPYLQIPPITDDVGSLWLRRNHASGGVPTYDAIDAAGRVVHRIGLPSGTQLVAVNERTVMVRRDGTDSLFFVARPR